MYFAVHNPSTPGQPLLYDRDTKGEWGRRSTLWANTWGGLEGCVWYQVKTLWVNGRVQIISLEEGDRAEAQEVDLHRAEYGTKWMLSQRGE